MTPRSELRLPVPPVSLPLHPGGSLLPFASLPSLPAHSHFFVTKISKFQWPGHSKVLGASAGPVLTSISSQDVGWSPLRRGRGCQLLHQADKNRWCVRAAQQHSAPALAMCQPARDLRPCWRQVVGFLRRRRPVRRKHGANLCLSETSRQPILLFPSGSSSFPDKAYTLWWPPVTLWMVGPEEAVQLAGQVSSAVLAGQAPFPGMPRSPGAPGWPRDVLHAHPCLLWPRVRSAL